MFLPASTEHLPFRSQFNYKPVPGSAHHVDLPGWREGEVGLTTTVVGWGYSCYIEDTREFCTESKQIATQTQQFLEVILICVIV